MCSHQLICHKSLLSQSLQEKWPPKYFKQSFDVIYKDQVPNIAIFLTAGSVELLSPGKELLISTPALIGVNELSQQAKSNCRVKILQGSYASVIDRMSLLDYLESYGDLLKITAS